MSESPATEKPSLAGEPTWIDLMTTDVGKAQAFYGGLFGWTFEDQGEEYGHYRLARKDGRAVAGVMARTPDMGSMPDVWSVYLDVADARRAASATAEQGGSVVVEPMAVGELGTMAVVADPSEAVVGLWQNASHTGIELTGAAGGPSWFELMTRDYDAAVAYYRDVLGWRTSTMSDTPQFRYTTLGEGDDARAGICDASTFLPADVPPHWQVYLTVDDTDAAVERVRELGGRVVTPAEDSPYGRIAGVCDDQGAMFRLIDTRD